MGIYVTIPEAPIFYSFVDKLILVFVIDYAMLLFSEPPYNREYGQLFGITFILLFYGYQAVDNRKNLPRSYLSVFALYDNFAGIHFGVMLLDQVVGHLFCEFHNGLNCERAIEDL